MSIANHTANVKILMNCLVSPNYFRKEWAKRELDALMGQQIATGKRVIPIWLNVTSADVAQFSPLLIDRIAIIAALGFEHVLSEVKRQIDAMDKCTDRELDNVVARFMDLDPDIQRFLERRSISNFSKLVCYYNAYEKRIDEIVAQHDNEDDDELAELSEAADRLMQRWLENALRSFNIPDHVYLDPPGPISSEDVNEIEARLYEWCKGTIGQYRSAELMYDLDEWLDADYLFVLFGIPNFQVSPAQRERLN